MSEKKERILIIDDSAMDIYYLVEGLKKDFQVLVATSGQRGLELANREPKPDVILMDVMMPEMSGYETCRRLKENTDTQDIDVIFLSSCDSIEDKLSGYDVGASDYLEKPVHIKELLKKIDLTVKSKQAKKEFEQEKKIAYNTAISAMSSAGEQGIIIDFLRKSNFISDVGSFAQLLVDKVSEYDLSSTIQVRANNTTTHASSEVPISPFEEDLLTITQGGNRIFEKGNRAIFNFNNLTVLIKDMPDDEERRGRFRDNLAILFESAETRLNSMSMVWALEELVSDAKNALGDIESEQRSHKIRGQTIMDSILRDVENGFSYLGLTEEQEDLIVKLIIKNVDRSLDHFEHGLIIDERMRDIIWRLTQMNIVTEKN